MLRSAFLLTLPLASLLISPSALAGKLDDAAGESDTRKSGGSGGSRKSSKSSSRSSNRYDDGDEDDASIGGELAVAVIYYVGLSPFTIPYHMTHGPGIPETVMAPSPYAAGCGYHCYRSEMAENYQKFGRFIMELEGGADFGRSATEIETGASTTPMPMGALGLRLETDFGFGLSTRLQGFREQESGEVDLALLGKSHVFYRFATSTHVQFRAGVGARYLQIDGDTSAGFDFLYAIDMQLGKPVDAQLEFDLAAVGAAFAPEIRGTLGFHLARARFYGGWHQNWVGSVRLGGPVLGVGGYF